MGLKIKWDSDDIDGDSANNDDDGFLKFGVWRPSSLF